MLLLTILQILELITAREPKDIVIMILVAFSVWIFHCNIQLYQGRPWNEPLTWSMVIHSGIPALFITVIAGLVVEGNDWVISKSIDPEPHLTSTLWHGSLITSLFGIFMLVTYFIIPFVIKYSVVIGYSGKIVGDMFYDIVKDMIRYGEDEQKNKKLKNH
ncbi:hypothetical protein D770_05390 [Flammeovirgaceae bacterium 311]|nr:hypothetical protein D770_05390 [Flammeovirgaceae bacterium 311]